MSCCYRNDFGRHFPKCPGMHSTGQLCLTCSKVWCSWKRGLTVLQLVLKLSSTERGAFFRHFSVSKVITTAHAPKVVSLLIFQELSNKKNKELQPNLSSRIAGPGELFSSDSQASAQSPGWATRCSLGSVSCSCVAAPRTAVRKRALPVASSLLRWAAKNVIDFCRADRNLSSKSLASYFESKKRKSKAVRRRRRKKKKKTTRSTCGGRSRPRPSIDRRSPQPQSLHIFFQICRVWCL